MMLHIVWEFYARPERQAEFEAHYGSNGSWAQLFRNSPDYQQTVLGRDRKDPARYIVIDIWKDMTAFDAFKANFKNEYSELDRRCEELTVVETCVGYFDTL
jgi:quinol monooxygenase YgiN